MGRRKRLPALPWPEAACAASHPATRDEVLTETWRAATRAATDRDVMMCGDSIGRPEDQRGCG